jgi:hypothetical protein
MYLIFILNDIVPFEQGQIEMKKTVHLIVFCVR